MKRRKKPRNINDVFDECDRMWRSIKRSIQRNPELINSISVHSLKIKWLDRNGYQHIKHGCFFCDYVEQQSTASSPGFNSDTRKPHYACINHCPGRTAAPDFLCQYLPDKPTWYQDPIGFANWIARLNRKRKRDAKKGEHNVTNRR